MRTRTPGFSLVEMLGATVLTTIVLGAIYQTIAVQQQGARRLGVMVDTEQSVRSSMQILQSELREIGATAGDVEEAASDHIKIRALRKAGLVCGNPISSTVANIYTFGDTLALGDTLSIYGDGRNSNPNDDVMVSGVISDLAAAPACPDTVNDATGAPWVTMNTKARRVTLSILSAQNLDLVGPGGVVRSYKRVTYGVYSRDGAYVFGRRDATSADAVVPLIGPLSSRGLSFVYFDTLNAALAGNPLTPAQRAIVGRIQVTLTGLTPGGNETGGAYSTALVSDVFLRGN
jgi:type II secretory pathway pseudopilin PulG